MTPSPSQQQILNFISQNEQLVSLQRQPRKHLIINSKAGSGKSTTCLQIIELLKSHSRSCAYLMLTKQTVEEFRHKAQQRNLTNVEISTAHSAGYAAIKNLGLKPKIDSSKFYKISDRFPLTKSTQKHLPLINRLVNLAKDSGLGLVKESDIENYSLWSSFLERLGESDVSNKELIIEWAIKMFHASINEHSFIDFADMLYMPLWINARPTQYDYVIVDEAQDTNFTRRELYKKMLKPWGGMIVVGDPHQAIYGFTGADNDSMEIFQKDLNAKTLSLSVCYRCDKKIIQEAQEYVPDIEAREDANEGSVSVLAYKDFVEQSEKLDLGPDDAILCRKNAPNTRLAFSLIRRGIPCRIEGRDIGFSLIKLIENLQGETLLQLQKSLNEYRESEVSKYLAKNQPSKADLAQDKCDTIECLIDRARELNKSVYDLRQMIMQMFSDANDPKTPKDVLTLSSVHKSKGREWKRVFLLGKSQFMPSKYAVQDWEVEQENNLIYVAITRAMNKLVFVTNVPEK